MLKSLWHDGVDDQVVPGQSHRPGRYRPVVAEPPLWAGDDNAHGRSTPILLWEHLRSQTRLLSGAQEAVEAISIVISMMKSDTLRRLATNYTRFRALFAAPGVDAAELDAAANRLGIPLPADYREFVVRYGGGQAGSFSVAGLRRWKAAGKGEWSIIELTEKFRAQRWPGTDRWAVFSSDGCGNPIGLDSDGRVWLSDHDCRECVCLEASFEDWLRRWALRIEPLRDSGYLAQQSWFQGHE